MRVFVAIPCQRKVCQILDQFSLDFKKILSGQYTTQYHCTLGFLGELDEHQIEEVHKRLSEIRFPRFRCSLGAFDTFDEKIIYAGVESEEIYKIQHLIAEQLTPWIETKTFVPHITVVRIKENCEHELIDKIITLKMPTFHFDVDEFMLYKSTATKEGSQYEALYTYFLEQPLKKVQKDFKLPPL